MQSRAGARSKASSTLSVAEKMALAISRSSASEPGKSTSSQRFVKRWHYFENRRTHGPMVGIYSWCMTTHCLFHQAILNRKGHSFSAAGIMCRRLQCLFVLATKPAVLPRVHSFKNMLSRPIMPIVALVHGQLAATICGPPGLLPIITDCHENEAFPPMKCIRWHV